MRSRSEFEMFNDEAFSESADLIGRESFTIAGVGNFLGILNEFTCEREVELGGKVGTYTATVLCSLYDFARVDGPLERTLDGKRVTIAGRDFKVARAYHDGTTLTLGLANPAK